MDFTRKELEEIRCSFREELKRKYCPSIDRLYMRLCYWNYGHDCMIFQFVRQLDEKQEIFLRKLCDKHKLILTQQKQGHYRGTWSIIKQLDHEGLFEDLERWFLDVNKYFNDKYK